LLKLVILFGLCLAKLIIGLIIPVLLLLFRRSNQLGDLLLLLSSLTVLSHSITGNDWFA